MPASASIWWRRSSVPEARCGFSSASTRSRPSMRPYSTFQPNEGVRRPPSISARASSSARRRDVRGARTLAGSSPSRMKGSPAQASARRASAIRPSVASDSVVGCSLISCMDAASKSAALVRKGDPANLPRRASCEQYIDWGPRCRDPRRRQTGSAAAPRRPAPRQARPRRGSCGRARRPPCGSRCRRSRT